MNVGAAALNLRPLSIGELLDRAFSLFFKNIVPLISLLAVVIIPMAIIQYFMVRDLLGLEFSLFQSVFTHPTKPPDINAINAINQATLRSEPLIGLNYLFGLVLVPVSNAAVVVGVSRAYLGHQIRFKECYSVALHRWLAVLLLIVMWVVTLIGAFLALFFFLLFGIFGLTFLAVALKTVGAVIAAIVGFALAVAVIGGVILCYMAFACSLVALMLEGVDPIRAFILGFDRIFGGGLFWRSVLMSLAMVALFFGFGSVAFGVGALLVWLTKSPAMYVAVSELANLIFLAFALVVVALYYYDVRIRREGFDLQILADQLAVAQRPR